MTSMLMILLASMMGIINGLYIDFNLCIAFYFLSFIIAIFINFIEIRVERKKVQFTNDTKESKARFNEDFKLDIYKFSCFLCISVFFFIYIKFQINCYDTHYETNNVSGEFEIISYPEEKEIYDKYIVKNEDGDKFLLYLSVSKELKKGSKICIDGDFELPDTERNKDGFNYRRYLNSQGIFGSIYVNNFFVSELPKFNLIYFIQEEIYSSLVRLFPKNEMGLILGMMIGETRDISEETKENFKTSGITHLIAVSGSNVAFIVLLVQLVFKKIIGKRNTYFISILFLIIFMLVSGASSSVIRATIMTILSIVADILYLKSDELSNLETSAFVLLLLNPLIVYDVGFILSFGGTIGILVLSKDFQKIFENFGRLKETLAVTCSAQLVLLPIMAHYFNNISLLSLITNILVVPISGIVTIMGFIIFFISKISFPFAQILAKSLYVLAMFIIKVAEFFAKIPFSNIQIITPNIFEILIFYFIIFYLTDKIGVFKRKYRFINGYSKQTNKKVKNICIILIIFIIVECVYYNFPSNYLDIRFVDVGQGDCIFIETNTRKNILIDGGGSENYDVGKNILLPYLLDMRVMHIDTIFSSHSDADHLYGLITILENIKVDNVIIGKNALGYDKLYELASKKGFDVIEVEKGDVIRVGDIIFEIISPNITMDNQDVNEYSLVFKLKYGEQSALFTGDIGNETEEKLYNLKADLLKVGHHGSKHSSSEKFINRVNPSLSIIQVDKNNRYGHPDKEIVKRLKKTSIVYTTAEHGEIQVKMYKNKIIVEE